MKAIKQGGGEKKRDTITPSGGETGKGSESIGRGTRPKTP